MEHAVAADAIGTATGEGSSTAERARAAVRLRSIDILRGVIIVLMTLDHVRFYFTDVRFDPLDLTQTNALLCATRWITHFCAPLFILLAGVSAFLSARRCTKAELSRVLATRGLWLILLEVTVVHFAWHFNLDYENGLFLQVIWAIGASMLALAALVHLPVWLVGAFGIALCLPTTCWMESRRNSSAHGRRSGPCCT
jgi:uncharacterized membrane protein